VPIAALEATSPATVFDFLDHHVSARGRAHWNWKYRLEGEAGRAFYHAGPDGIVGGFIGTIPTTLHVAGGGNARAAWFVDWATRPGEGGIGAGVALLRRAEMETEILLTLQGSADTQKILPKLRWNVVDTPAVWILRLSPHSIVMRGPLRDRSWLHGPALLAGAAVARARRVSRTAASSFALEEVERFPAAYDPIWEARREEFAPLAERSSAQLNFMCADYPDGGYHRYLMRADGALVGHLVLRLDRRNGERRGRIIDTLWPRTQAGAVEWLVREACAMLQEESVDYIECTSSIPELDRALGGCRFARLRSVPVWYHRLPDGIPTPESWFITYLDCDRAYR
jgi:hypothetical protein